MKKNSNNSGSKCANLKLDNIEATWPPYLKVGWALGSLKGNSLT